jgi:hypothetical protein
VIQNSEEYEVYPKIWNIWRFVVFDVLANQTCRAQNRAPQRKMTTVHFSLGLSTRNMDKFCPLLTPDLSLLPHVVARHSYLPHFGTFCPILSRDFPICCFLLLLSTLVLE